ncbi:hypothetical protein O181_030102 [Austropuccinia psidii MF-1]|uniref:Uncharacterized protein n=1 Tax=Austropuccinia psidii MF-1 TaxID=1389203 RepID=A0A9Q3CV39_9BASI|nr:hypothetical protein [Austropuccinia psidii MF-1]
MSHTLTCHIIENVQLCHHHVGWGSGPYAHAYGPGPARAHTHAPAPAWEHAHAPAPAHTNATAPHPWYCAAGSTSVIHKMKIPRRRSPFMDDLVR